MIRIAIRAWAFCFASLTILPGCQLFSPFGSGAVGAAKDDRSLTHSPVHFKPEPGESSHEVSQSKSVKPYGPVIEPLQLEKLDKGVGKVDMAGPVKVGDSEISVAPKDAQPALQQAPGPLPQIVEPNKINREYAPLVKALQCILEGRHEEGIEHLRVYDDRTQEFLIRLLPTLTIFVRKGLDEMSASEVAVLNNQLIGLLATLRPRSELLIDKMCYCKQIRGFGAYEMLPGNHVFLSAAKDRPGEWVQLYVELKNFASEAGKDGEYLTKLVCSLELQNAKGEKVWSHTYDRKDTTHPRRTRLNDFHGDYGFYVPELAAGDYKLTIRIVDETVAGHRRDVSKALAFRVTPVLNHTTLR